MRTTRLAKVAALAMAAGLIMAADATAQFGGGMPGGGGRHGARMEKGAAPGAGRSAPQENFADVIEYRLALLQEDLKLSREQERAWAEFEERVKALAADIVRERGRMRSTMTMHAVDQVNHAVDTARNRLAAWEEVASVTRVLYDELTPQQKALADERSSSIVAGLLAGGISGAVAAPRQ